MPIKVLGIAPYQGLRDLFYEIARLEKRIELDVAVADLGEALSIIKQESINGYDIIISRGGTASLIREHVNIPVVDIPVSGYDLLRVLTLIKDSNSKVAVVGFSNICQGAQTVSNLLDIDIPVYPVKHESEVRDTLEKALQDGTQIILGDVVTVRIASEMGSNGILITSGRESVQEAFSEALRIYDVYRRELEKAKFFEKILKFDPRGIFVLSANGVLKFANRSAGELLGVEIQHYIHESIENVAPELFTKVRDVLLYKQESMRGTVSLQEQLFNIHVLNVLEDGPFVIVYLERSELTRHGNKTSLRSPARIGTFAQIIGSSEPVQKLIEKAKMMSITNQNIWMTGEPGTGKLLLAQAIHHASQHSTGHFFILSCDTLEPDELDMELFGASNTPGFFDKIPNGTVYLEHFECFPQHLQQKLAVRIAQGLNIRFIVSSAVPLVRLMEQPDFSEKLIHFLAEHYLNLPPLRERMDDMDEIARVWIAEHNSKYGKQIVGVREEVLKLLKSRDWPGNIKEFKNTFEEMLLLTKGHYVDLEEAELVWGRYDTAYNRTKLCDAKISGHTVQVDLSGTLEEIEAQIFMHVLKEESMNQSKAASRLGINRSTLWRKLKGK